MRSKLAVIAIPLVATIAFSCCKKGGSSSCSITGTALNTGIPGANTTIGLGNNDSLNFNSPSLGFYIKSNSGVSGLLEDVGAKSCLSFADTFSHGTTLVAYKKGDGYIGKFPDGHTVLFIAGALNNGVVTVDYLYE